VIQSGAMNNTAVTPSGARYNFNGLGILAICCSVCIARLICA
jgi:hypothetical protein